MNKSAKNIAILFMLIVGVVSCRKPEQKVTTTSPDGSIKVEFILKDGAPFYTVNVDGKILLDTSALGYIIKRIPSLNFHFEVMAVNKRMTNDVWEPVWGQEKSIRNNFNELSVSLKQLPPQNRRLDIIFRVFDDGVAFRYIIPSQPNLKSIEIVKELSQFNFRNNTDAWWIPADFNSNAYMYRCSKISDLKAINTPVTFFQGDSLYYAVHEAQLIDYPAMSLTNSVDKPHALETTLTPWPDKSLVKTTTPMKSPWRTIQIARSLQRLAASRMILNLNDPTRIRDVSFIKPMKYIGISWSLLLGTETSEEGPKHGATTKNVKKYIDFAAANNIQAVLIEGWNSGWNENPHLNNFDQTTPALDFNWAELQKYASEKDIALMSYNEVSGELSSFERNLASAFKKYNELGINMAKISYRGKISNNHNYLFSQLMVNHYLMTIREAAENKVMVVMNEQVHETGLSRTYPNLMATNGLRNQRWNTTSEANTPQYLTILPFTSLLAGPADYCPGIFNLTSLGKNKDRKIQTTLANQLALMVVIYSPLQMAGDIIDNYDKKPAFQFIRDLETNWDKSLVLDAKLGEYVCIARNSGTNWFLGAISDENSRQLDIPLQFLDYEQKYLAKIYADGKDADFQTNPYAIEIIKDTLQATDTLKIKLAKGGGQAVSFTPIFENN